MTTKGKIGRPPKFSLAEVQTIHRAYELGDTVGEIAERFNTSVHLIHKVLKWEGAYKEFRYAQTPADTDDFPTQTTA